MRTGAVVLAAGFGSLRDGRPKVLETVGGVPLVCRAIRAADEAGLSPIVVVLSRLFDQEVQQILTQTFPTCHYAFQDDRTGTAEAVLAALPMCSANGVEHIVVIYADMPLWTAATVRLLAGIHVQSAPVMSMVTIRLNGHHPPELERYGRVVRGEAGQIIRIVEPADATPEEHQLRWVNPSLYAFNCSWLREHAFHIVPKDKRDGRGPERHIPALVSMARTERQPIFELPLLDSREALGVNTIEELDKAESVLEASLSARLPE